MRSNEIQPGMRLAKSIYDPNGNILMRAGAVITQRHLKAFKSWGILEASIQPDAETSHGPTADLVATAEIRALLESQFSLSNLEHPVVQAIHDLCLARAIGQR